MDIRQLEALNNKRQLMSRSEYNPDLYAFTREPEDTRLNIIRANISNPQQLQDEKYKKEYERADNSFQKNINYNSAITNGTFDVNSEYETAAMEHTSLGRMFSGGMYRDLADEYPTDYGLASTDHLGEVISSNRAADAFKNAEYGPQTQLAKEISKELASTLGLSRPTNVRGF